MTILSLATLSCLLFFSAQAGQATFDELSAHATAAREANDVPHAIELYRQALQLNAEWEEGWWFLGSLLYDTDQYAEARVALTHVVELDSKATPAWALLGLCDFETGDYAASLKHIQRGEAAGPPPQMASVLRFHEAQLLTRDGQFDQALEKYAWFARKGVQNPELVSALGLAALRSALLPKDIPADRRELYQMAGRAAYFSMNGDFESAQQALILLLERFPAAHYVHYLYGCFLLAANPDAAIDQLRRELEVTPSSGAANAMLAWALLERGDTNSALPYAQNAARGEPTLPLAQYVFGRCLLDKGELDDAIEHLERAAESDPANLETHASLATAYSRAGRPREARQERLRTLELWKRKDSVANP